MKRKALFSAMALGAFAMMAQDALPTEVITDPQGEHKSYSLTGKQFFPLDWLDELAVVADSGVAVDVVFDENGDVYIENPISRLPTGSYMKGTRDGSIITFTFPQCLVNEQGENLSVLLYADRLAWDDNSQYFYHDEKCHDITYSIDSEGVIRMLDDGSFILGIYAGDQWGEYGDFMTTLYPMTDKMETMPQDAKLETWTMITEGNGWPVMMAVKDKDMYITGLFEAFPDATIRGTINSSGTRVMFPDAQYIGLMTDDDRISRHMYIRTGEVEKVWNDLLGAYTQAYITNYPENTMIYSEENGGLTSDIDFFINAGKVGNMIWDVNDGMVINPLMRRYDANFTPAKPRDPEIVSYREYGGADMAGYLAFDIVKFDEDNNFLQPERLHWNVYFNGKKATLDTDNYRYISSPITDIPYYFNDGEVNGSNGIDICADGAHHAIYFYEPLESVGVSVTYTDKNGNTYTSNVAGMNVDGVEDIPAGDDVKSEELFDLQGRRIRHAEKGSICVKRITRANGEVETFKEMR